VIHKTAQIFVAILLAVAASCAPGTMIIRQNANTPPTLGTAPDDGKYGLFIVGETEPVIVYQLNKGDKLGFQIGDGGTIGNWKVNYLYAVPGNHPTFRLDMRQSYEWRKL
jgi:hypothetical protein